MYRLPSVALADATYTTPTLSGGVVGYGPYIDPLIYQEKNRLTELYNGKEQEINRRYPQGTPKLIQILARFPYTKGTFIDIAGGPGAFTEVLLAEGFTHGFGITLRPVNQRDRGLGWYKHLYHYKRKFTVLWGETGNGDLTVLANILHAASAVRSKYPEGVNVAVADGGERETSLVRLLVGEFYLTLLTLVNGGLALWKLYDCTLTETIQVMYLASILFEEAYIVKPEKPRDSERYLVGVGYKGVSEATRLALERGIAGQDMGVPIPVEFVNVVRTIGDTLCIAQTKALQEILDTLR